jgi:hypothetical protein
MTLLLRLSPGQSAGRYVRVPPALCSDVDNRVITGITLGGQDEAQSEDKSKPRRYALKVAVLPTFYSKELEKAKQILQQQMRKRK